MNVSAILIGDMHLSMKNPVCRTDSMFDALKSKMAFLKTMQERYNCPILAPGDIFDVSNPPHELVRYCLQNLPHLYVVPGQHDLPAHSFEEFHRSGLGVLEAAEKITLVTKDGLDFKGFRAYGFGWNDEFFPIEESDIPTVVMMHYFVYSGDKTPFPGLTIANHTSHIFSIFKNANLILTGDNHQSFFIKKGKNLLVNCGSILRTTAKQINHIPTLCLWDANINKIKKVPFPFFENVISTEHLGKIAKHIKGHQFINLLDSVSEIDWTIKKFPELLERYFLVHDVDVQVQKLIMGYFESVKGRK